MTIGERIEQRRLALDIPSQSALARLANMRQSTLNGLIRKPYRSSPYLGQIARALQTSVEYLMGESGDPDLNGTLPPAPQVVMMGVVLPPARSLARMFEGLLDGIDDRATKAERARLLAERLPIGLAQLRDPAAESTNPVWPAPASEDAAADSAMPDPEPTR